MKKMYKYEIEGRNRKVLLSTSCYHNENDMVQFAQGLLEGTKVFRSDVTVKVYDDGLLIYKIR